MTRNGWDKLLSDVPNSRGAGHFPITAYSEFMPPPRIGWRPYGDHHTAPRSGDDSFAWQISEWEEIVQLQPGLQHVATRILHVLGHLDRPQPAQGISRAKLEGNRYWPRELAERNGPPSHERFVTLMPLALSLTQDDKGRVRWTLFGGSEQGPDRAFWKSFYTAPGREKPPEYGVDFIRRLLHAAYGESLERLADLMRCGFRILPGSGEKVCGLWRQDPLPGWARSFVLGSREPVGRVKYLLTFRPFGDLPPAVRKAYLAGKLHLLPFPGSLIFWGAPRHLTLQRQLPLAMQIPLLNVLDRYEALRGLRIPQSGWLHEPHADMPEPDHERGKVRNSYRRTHRWARVERHQDELEVDGHEDRLAHVLFSSDPKDVGLYGKPMARNAQIWTDTYELLLDGPRAGRKELARAATALRNGGQFGYRFHFPPMQVGKYEVFWHRPLVAFLDAASGQTRCLEDAPAGYLTAYDRERPDLHKPVELWPELLSRPERLLVAEGLSQAYEHREHQVCLNVHKLLEACGVSSQEALPHGFARAMLTIPKDQPIEEWLKHIAHDVEDGRCEQILHRTLRKVIHPSHDPALAPPPASITFGQTANRKFEVAYWKTIASLATGQFVNKDNADCVHDPASQALLKHHHRDLDALGDHLLAYYGKLIARHGMQGKALAGELPFSWTTDFDFEWMGGWKANRKQAARERDLMVVIPGRDRRRAVIMADHYDTAYMEDRYYPERGGTLARVAAAGADDNHSATATLMLGADLFMQLSRAGKLGCDVWLVHLTGEEFPADCMGARHLAQLVVERSLKLHVAGRKPTDLSKVRVDGVYVLDMIAHNREHDRDVFQISPGQGAESLGLAHEAQVANTVWNDGASEWNRRPDRRSRGRGQRSADGVAIPAVAQFPRLHGEVRTLQDPRSSLFNTDGQIFSDAGIPVVLFMENYDINRVGYHDTHDNMSNIDLDYGTAVAAIAIESVARAAGRPGKPRTKGTG